MVHVELKVIPPTADLVFDVELLKIESVEMETLKKEGDGKTFPKRVMS